MDDLEGGRACVSLVGGVTLAIESLRSLPAEALPARQHYVYIARIELERRAAPTGPLAGDQGGARAREQVQDQVSVGEFEERLSALEAAVGQRSGAEENAAFPAEATP